MNDPGLVRIIIEQLEANTAECKFFESFDSETDKPRNPLFCRDCNGKDYSCEFYTPKYIELSSLDPKE